MATAVAPSTTNFIVDQFGVYMDTDGTYYLQDGTPLLQYNPANGVYQEDVTPYDPTIYSAAGLSIGNATNGDTVKSVTPPKSNIVWYVVGGVSLIAVGFLLLHKHKNK